jgi:hypothetical protein
VPPNGSSISEISVPGTSNAMQIAEQEAMQNKADSPSVAKSMTFIPYVYSFVYQVSLKSN